VLRSMMDVMLLLFFSISCFLLICGFFSVSEMLHVTRSVFRWLLISLKNSHFPMAGP